jgi:hypothetical protein
MIESSKFVDILYSEFGNSEYADAAVVASKYEGLFKKYLEDNLEVSYAWVGVNPASGAPDPVVSAKGSISFASFKITGGMSAEFAEQAFCLKITNALKLGLITLSDSSFVVAPLVLNPAGVIVTAFGSKSTLYKNSSTKDIAIAFYKEIFDALKLVMINPIPTPGAHGAFTGTLSMVGIL